MTTRKKMRSKRRHRHKRHTNKMLKNKEKKEKKHGSFRRRHHKTTVSSWDKHYTYESNIVNSEMNNKLDHNKDNDVQAVHGLKDFLQGKK
jgi:hypothetical protein